MKRVTGYLLLLPAMLLAGGSALAAQADTKVNHKAIGHFVPEKRIRVEARVNDPKGVNLVRAYFKSDAHADYLFVPMEPLGTDPNSYAGCLPAPAASTATMEYLFLVVNGGKQVVKTAPPVTAKARADKDAPSWQMGCGNDQLTVWKELPEVPSPTGAYADSVVMDVAESGARFGVVAGLFGGGGSSSAAVAATGASDAGSVALAGAGGIGGGGVLAALLVGGAAAAAGGGGGGGGSTPDSPPPSQQLYSVATQTTCTWSGPSLSTPPSYSTTLSNQNLPGGSDPRDVYCHTFRPQPNSNLTPIATQLSQQGVSVGSWSRNFCNFSGTAGNMQEETMASALVCDQFGQNCFTESSMLICNTSDSFTPQ